MPCSCTTSCWPGLGSTRMWCMGTRSASWRTRPTASRWGPLLAASLRGLARRACRNLPPVQEVPGSSFRLLPPFAEKQHPVGIRQARRRPGPCTPHCRPQPSWAGRRWCWPRARRSCWRCRGTSATASSRQTCRPGRSRACGRPGSCRCRCRWHCSAGRRLLPSWTTVTPSWPSAATGGCHPALQHACAASSVDAGLMCHHLVQHLEVGPARAARAGSEAGQHGLPQVRQQRQPRLQLHGHSRRALSSTVLAGHLLPQQGPACLLALTPVCGRGRALCDWHATRQAAPVPSRAAEAVDRRRHRVPAACPHSAALLLCCAADQLWHPPWQMGSGDS